MFILRYFVFAIGIFSSLSAYSNDLVRKYPYPYSNVVSFTSDIDMQFPWFTEGLHHYFNEKLGLPISDSTWVQGNIPTFSYIFNPDMTFNRQSHSIGNKVTFFLILQQWHRGNVDHIHGWQDDGVLAIECFDSRQGVDLNKPDIKVSAKPAPEGTRSMKYTNIRFFLSEKPGDSFSIALYDQNGHKVEISPHAIQEALRYQIGSQSMPVCINLIVSFGKNPLIVFSDSAFSLVDLKTIEFRDASDSHQKNPLKLFRVEMDNFSRQTTLEQSQALEKFHIYPNLMTCHGGNTLNQNICRIELLVEGRKLKCYADDIKRHAYHMDVLKILGVKAIWPYSGKGFGSKEYVSNDELNGQLFPYIYPNFYFLRRTIIRRNSLTFKDYLGYITSDLKNITDEEKELFIDSIEEKDFNPAFWNFWGGVSFGAYTLQAINSIREGKSVNHQWYTHFGTLSYIEQLGSTPQKTLTAPIRHAAHVLSDYMYNFYGNKNFDERIWVTSASVYVRYFIVHPHVKENASIDFDSSMIHIKSAKDKTTADLIPNPDFGSRDLHGLTFYVKNPDKAHIYVDQKEVTAFTKNPIDETGKPSVTVVDDHLPTELLPTHGLLAFQGAQSLSDIIVTNNSNGSMLLEAAQDGDVSMEFLPHNLTVWNISHLHLDWFVQKTPSSRLYIEIIRDDNQVVGLYETKKDAKASQAYWLIDPKDAKITLAHDQLSFNSPLRGVDSNPLVLGRIKKIRVSMRNAKKGDQVLLGKFLALRPSGNDSSSKGLCVLGGQVVGIDGKPISQKVVSLRINGKREIYKTSTDQNGYYVFFDLPKGATLSPYVHVNDKEFFPLKGSKFMLLKDEMEFDIKAG